MADDAVGVLIILNETGASAGTFFLECNKLRLAKSEASC